MVTILGNSVHSAADVLLDVAMISIADEEVVIARFMSVFILFRSPSYTVFMLSAVALTLGLSVGSFLDGVLFVAAVGRAGWQLVLVGEEEEEEWREERRQGGEEKLVSSKVSCHI